MRSKGPWPKGSALSTEEMLKGREQTRQHGCDPYLGYMALTLGFTRQDAGETERDPVYLFNSVCQACVPYYARNASSP